ncbi:unnamed protein product [Ectocarpus sp. 8 AP-2014]
MRHCACAALSVWLGLQQQASSFIFPGVCNPKQSRQLDRQSTAVLLQGGGLEGGPAKPHTPTSDIQAAADHDDRHGEMSNSDDEATTGSDSEDEEPFPIWKGMSAFEDAETGSEAEEGGAPVAGVIVVDPFCDYLGKRCINILEEAGYAVVQVLSDHLVATLNSESAKGFRPPSPGKEAEWASWLPFPIVAVICESDAGLANAERLQAALLGPRFGGNNDARRDKFLMNEAMRTAGLAAARQIKTGDRAKVRQFLATLETTTTAPPPTPAQQQDAQQLEQTGGREVAADADGDLAVPMPEENSENVPEAKGRGGRGEEQEEDGGDGNSRGVLSVVKPARGCASGSVFRCQGEREAMEAFDKILGTPKYGTPGEFNDEVLVQEFLVGTEYVVDTVSRDGEHKAVAIWRYDKRPANGAPFVYFSVKLMPSDGQAEQKVVEYAFKALDALGITFGPTHTEIMMVGAHGGDDGTTSPGEGTPTLVEVNTRWHLTDFAPLTDACIGYNAVEETLAAYLDPGRFDALPRVPPTGKDSRYGRVVHLVSYVEGALERIFHEEEIRSLESFAGIDVYADPKNGGSGHVKKTIDIRSDAGWVRLVHDDEEVVERDYRRMVELMPTMYKVSGDSSSSG